MLNLVVRKETARLWKVNEQCDIIYLLFIKIQQSTVIWCYAFCCVYTLYCERDSSSNIENVYLFGLYE